MAQHATLSPGASAFQWSMKWSDPFTAFSLYGSWFCKRALRFASQCINLDNKDTLWHTILLYMRHFSKLTISLSMTEPHCHVGAQIYLLLIGLWVFWKTGMYWPLSYVIIVGNSQISSKTWNLSPFTPSNFIVQICKCF